MKHPKLKKIVVILILVVAIGLSATERVDQALRRLGMDNLLAANEAYLQQSMDKAVSGFLILSGIKTGLAVIEGSEIGIGFNLELGDVVQSVYDYVDIAWKTALAGGTVILLTRLVVQTVDLVNHWCLTIALLAALVTYLIQLIQWRPLRSARSVRIAKDAFFFLSVASAVLYFVFPLSITGAALLSEKITGPLIDESQRSFESIKDDFSAENINRRLFPDQGQAEEGWLTHFLFRGDTEEIKAYFKEQAEYFKEKSRDIAIWTLQLIAGYLFDSIVFPVTFFLLLFVVAKGALLYFFEDRKHHSLREELTTLVDSYHNLGRPSARTSRPRPNRRSKSPRYRRYSRRSG